MALVDYSDSESESDTPTTKAETVPKPAAAPKNAPNKKPFQKIVDRSNPGKIQISLPTVSTSEDNDTTQAEEPPAKRAKTGGGRFSGFSSFLPPPKKTAAAGATRSSAQSASGRAAPRPGVHLKTGAEPAFSRESYGTEEWGEGEEGQELDGLASGPGLNLPPPKSATQAAPIPTEQEPATEVKLVGKPLMFKPLSVTRKPAKKAAKPPAATPAVANTEQSGIESNGGAAKEEAPRKKISLFSIPDEPPAAEIPAATSGAYEPVLFGNEESRTTDGGDDQDYDNLDAYGQSDPSLPVSSTAPHPALAQTQASLDTIAADLNLSASARRELFGRTGSAAAGATAARVTTFDMRREYAHNEALRASGELAAAQHNPVRAIAPGKHSLRQIVNAVQSQTEALEDSFAQNRGKKKSAAGRYGW